MMPFAATWMDLEMIILNEVCQRQISHKVLAFGLIFRTPIPLVLQSLKPDGVNWRSNGFPAWN